MGILVQGILCYGFRIKDEDGNEENVTINWLPKDPDGAEGDFEDFLAKLFGLKEPDSQYDEKRYATDPEYKRMWSSYWEKKNKLEEEIGVTLVHHCSGEQRMCILAVTESVREANWGEPVNLGQSITDKQTEWREKLRAFCERVNIQFEEPQLILCSYYG
ncbi:MAG: hypothetical protein HYY86_01875 [Candidatus Harrisonbacteria bacterium]|nr:hypothetical protein [Candidatus Harrisonbacteria bacterium]